MLNKQFTPQELVDSLFSFEAGINSGVAPLLLQRNQLASAMNTTVRGSFATHRPTYFKITLDEAGQALLNSALSQGPFQASGFYNPDVGDEYLVILVSGRLFTITPADTTATVAEITIGGDPQNASVFQGWMWQAEKWMIINDGVGNPVFWDGATATRSNRGSVTLFSSTTTATLITPPVGGSGSVNFASVVGLVIGDIVTLQYVGTMQVKDINNPNPGDVTFLNLTMGGVEWVPSGRAVSWQHTATGFQLPPGRMGVYGMGRNWMSLLDGKQFVASDIVGGSSGTQAENYRDAVLNITENLYLAGGGNFSVPGSVGDIRAMRFTATLDASLGQGPLQIFTPTCVFSCNAPVDRLTWQDVTNPILTQSLIGSGALSQYGTVNANSDIIFRSPVGIGSLILARRDFSTWGNTPISSEVSPRMARDSEDLLGFTSAIVFDNRLLMTTAPVLSDFGVYWRAIVPLNFDPLSSLRGKAPSVYDALTWTGLNVFQLCTGMFSNVERAFAFCLNTNDNTFELYELNKTPPVEDDNTEPVPVKLIYDNADTRIVWTIASAVIDFGERDPRTRRRKRLINGEFYIDSMAPNTRLDYQAWYRPDQWACWIPWFRSFECALEGKNQYRSRLGLGEPDPHACDESNNKPQREFYTMQVKFVFQGHCRFLGARFQCITVPEAEFAQPCPPPCQP